MRNLWLPMCLLFLGCAPSSAEPGAVRERLLKAVPLQSSPETVLTYLDQQKVEHSPYHQDPSAGNVINAMVRERSGWSLVKKSYKVTFRFDDQRRLAECRVEPAYTGP
jgi:hypothetical protein